MGPLEFVRNRLAVGAKLNVLLQLILDCAKDIIIRRLLFELQCKDFFENVSKVFRDDPKHFLGVFDL